MKIKIYHLLEHSTWDDVIRVLSSDKGHLTSKQNSMTVPVLLSLIFPFILSPSPGHPTGFSFCIFSGFLAIFILLSSDNNNNINKYDSTTLSMAENAVEETASHRRRIFLEISPEEARISYYWGEYDGYNTRHVVAITHWEN